jgi:hypothetical protein
MLWLIIGNKGEEQIFQGNSLPLADPPPAAGPGCQSADAGMWRTHSCVPRRDFLDAV